jgi:epsilon-lactone hydrolase
MNAKKLVSLRARLVRSALSLMRGPFANISVEQTRALTKNARMPFPSEVRVEQAKGIPGQWITGKGASPKNVMLYLHGGCYVQNTPSTHHAMIGRICNAAHVKCLYVDYRLAPEFPFPAALDDTITAYQWLLDGGISPQHIIFAGDSAGGGLALAALLKLREMRVALPAAAVLLSPWCDLELNTASAQADSDPIYSRKTFLKFGRLYANTMPLNHPLLSPIHAELRDLPPLLIQAGELELLLDDAKQLTSKVRAVGGSVELSIYPGMWHVWQVYPPFLVPESKPALGQIATFIRQNL